MGWGWSGRCRQRTGTCGREGCGMEPHDYVRATHSSNTTPTTHQSMATSCVFRHAPRNLPVRASLPAAHTTSMSCWASMCTTCVDARASWRRAVACWVLESGWGVSTSARSAMTVEDKSSWDDDALAADGCCVIAIMHVVCMRACRGTTGRRARRFATHKPCCSWRISCVPVPARSIATCCGWLGCVELGDGEVRWCTCLLRNELLTMLPLVLLFTSRYAMLFTDVCQMSVRCCQKYTVQQNRTLQKRSCSNKTCTQRWRYTSNQLTLLAVRRSNALRRKPVSCDVTCWRPSSVDAMDCPLGGCVCVYFANGPCSMSK